MMNEEEIFELLKSRLHDKAIYDFDVYPRDIAFCKVKILNGKIYFPNYTYGSHMSDNPIIQSYHGKGYSSTSHILKNFDLGEVSGLPVADKCDDVYCKCFSNKFKFSYRSYALDVECTECGNSWCAYSG